jgi:hypothetical protein
MAQKTTYTILGIPGQTQSFTAKTATAAAAQLQRDVLLAAGMVTALPEVAPALSAGVLTGPEIGPILAAATLDAPIVGPIVAVGTLPTREIGPYLAAA